MPELTHVDARGNARMVEVGGKPITDRVAVAEGFITLNEAATTAVRERSAKKGDVLTIAQLAGIMGAKHTGDLIPLCHPLPLTGVDVELSLEADRIRCIARARATWHTGVEMEAMVAVTTALLTVYDMLKAVDRGMVLGPVRLVEKHGGASGSWKAAEPG